MNQSEETSINRVRQEIYDLRQSIDRKLMWGAGIFMVGLSSLGLWALDQNSRNITTTEIASAALERSKENTATLARNNRELGELGVEIKAQGRTLGRIDTSLAELTRYLRRGGADR